MGCRVRGRGHGGLGDALARARPVPAPGAALAPRDLSGPLSRHRGLPSKSRGPARDAGGRDPKLLSRPRRSRDALEGVSDTAPGAAARVGGTHPLARRQPRLSRGRRDTRPTRVLSRHPAVLRERAGRRGVPAGVGHSRHRCRRRPTGAGPRAGRRRPRASRTRPTTHDARGMHAIVAALPSGAASRADSGRGSAPCRRAMSTRCSAAGGVSGRPARPRVARSVRGHLPADAARAGLGRGRGAGRGVARPASRADRALHRRAVRVVPPSHRGSGPDRDLRLRRVLRRGDESRGVRRRRAFSAVPRPADTAACRRRDRAAGPPGRAAAIRHRHALVRAGRSPVSRSEAAPGNRRSRSWTCWATSSPPGWRARRWCRPRTTRSPKPSHGGSGSPSARASRWTAAAPAQRDRLSGVHGRGAGRHRRRRPAGDRVDRELWPGWSSCAGTAA